MGSESPLAIFRLSESSAIEYSKAVVAGILAIATASVTSTACGSLDASPHELLQAFKPGMELLGMGTAGVFFLSSFFHLLVATKS